MIPSSAVILAVHGNVTMCCDWSVWVTVQLDSPAQCVLPWEPGACTVADYGQGYGPACPQQGVGGAVPYGAACIALMAVVDVSLMRAQAGRSCFMIACTEGRLHVAQWLQANCSIDINAVDEVPC